jgi:hypothetical protein
LGLLGIKREWVEELKVTSDREYGEKKTSK